MHQSGVELAKEKKLRIELYGGLGNQLLIYFAGLVLSKKSSRGLEIDFFWKDSIHSKVYDITSIRLVGRIYRRNINPMVRSLVKILWRFRDSMSYRLTLYRKFEFYILGIFRESSNLSDSLKKNPEFLLMSSRKKVTLKGYFFSNKYFLNLQSSDLANFKILSPSTEFLDISKEITESHLIGIHLRKWEGNVESFGQLNENYFLKALAKARETSGKNKFPIWIFVENSEDLNNFPNLTKSADRILTPYDLPDPAETLFLLSLCRQLIISNSTFSYCAALISDEGKTTVYAPWPFRPSSEGINREDIHLQHWKQIETEWL